MQELGFIMAWQESGDLSILDVDFTVEQFGVQGYSWKDCSASKKMWFTCLLSSVPCMEYITSLLCRLHRLPVLLAANQDVDLYL